MIFSLKMNCNFILAHFLVKLYFRMVTRITKAEFSLYVEEYNSSIHTRACGSSCPIQQSHDALTHVFSCIDAAITVRDKGIVAGESELIKISKILLSVAIVVLEPIANTETVSSEATPDDVFTAACAAATAKSAASASAASASAE